MPGCHLTWPLLAGIGKVESAHASGGKVDANGTTRGRILGPVLNGGPGMAAIADTDQGRTTGTRAGTVRSGRCSSSRAPGRRSAPTATATGSRTRTTCSTRPGRQGTTSVPAARTWRPAGPRAGGAAVQPLDGLRVDVLRWMQSYSKQTGDDPGHPGPITPPRTTTATSSTTTTRRGPSTTTTPTPTPTPTVLPTTPRADHATADDPDDDRADDRPATHADADHRRSTKPPTRRRPTPTPSRTTTTPPTTPHHADVRRRRRPRRLRRPHADADTPTPTGRRRRRRRRPRRRPDVPTPCDTPGRPTSGRPRAPAADPERAMRPPGPDRVPATR